MEKLIVLISGANQGLGYETAKSLLSEQHNNYHVIIGSRNAAKGTEAVDSLKKFVTQPGTSISTIQLDLTDKVSVDAAAAHIRSHFGRLDVLVNNDAIYLMQDKVIRDTLADRLATNVTGTASLIEAMLPLLQRAKSLHPHVVFVSSSMGSLSLNGDPSFPSYGAWAMGYRVTKAALNMLLVLYNSKLQGLTVVGVDPGFCATNMLGDWLPERELFRGSIIVIFRRLQMLLETLTKRASALSLFNEDFLHVALGDRIDGDVVGGAQFDESF